MNSPCSDGCRCAWCGAEWNHNDTEGAYSEVLEERDAALRELDAVRAELSRERRRVRQLRRAVLACRADTIAARFWSLMTEADICDDEPESERRQFAMVCHRIARGLSRRARDRSHDDD